MAYPIKWSLTAAKELRGSRCNECPALANGLFHAVSDRNFQYQISEQYRGAKSSVGKAETPASLGMEIGRMGDGFTSWLRDVDHVKTGTD